MQGWITMNPIRWLGLFGLALGLALLLSPALALYKAQETRSAALRPSAAENEQAAAPRAKVTNPHGPIAIPCQNCHTYTSWKPIRSMPEFNHDMTRYPLRGMHKDVACSKCH